MDTNTNNFLSTISSFNESTAIEIRFHANRTEQAFQLLASATESGSVRYTLHYNPRGFYSMALSYIVGHDKSHVTLPMKAYSGWQGDVLAWMQSMSNYTVDQVL